MRRQAVLVVGAVVLVFAQCAGGSGRPSDANSLVKLEDYLIVASLNNAALKVSFERWKAAVESIPQAKSLPDPKFTYAYFIEEVETRVGPQRQKFDITQTFPWFGTIKARTDEAAAKAKAAYKRYEARKLQLFRQVKHVFYEYDYLAKATEITSENLQLVENFEEVARSRYATSATSHPDIIRAQIELAILEDRLKSLQELRPAIVARLNSILNRPVSSDLPWPEPSPYQPVSIDFSQLNALIVRNNPDLQAANYEIKAARSGERLAKKRSYPGIGIGVSYIDTAHAMASGVDDSGKDPIMGVVSLTLPIWADSYNAAERQARTQLRAKTHEKIQMKNELAAKARQLLYEFEDNDRKIRLYRDVIISKAKDMLVVSETAYLGGTIDFLSLIDAQRTLLKYELYYERLVSENAQKLAELDMLAGADLSKMAPEIVEK